MLQAAGLREIKSKLDAPLSGFRCRFTRETKPSRILFFLETFASPIVDSDSISVLLLGRDERPASAGEVALLQLPRGRHRSPEERPRGPESRRKCGRKQGPAKRLPPPGEKSLLVMCLSERSLEACFGAALLLATRERYENNMKD